MMALRTSICLNNIGVHLLEKGACHPAILTLLDALTMVKTVLSEPLRDEQIVLEQQQQVLKKAYQRSAQTMASASSWLTEDISLNSVSHDTCPSVILFWERPSAEESSPAKQRFTLIRIDGLDTDTTDGMVQSDTETYIILYNLAVAFSLVAAEARHRRREQADMAEQNSQSAHRLFGMVLQLLANGNIARQHLPFQILVEILIMTTTSQPQGVPGSSMGGTTTQPGAPEALVGNTTYAATLLERMRLVWGAFLSLPRGYVAAAA